MRWLLKLYLPADTSIVEGVIDDSDHNSIICLHDDLVVISLHYLYKLGKTKDLASICSENEYIDDISTRSGGAAKERVTTAYTCPNPIISQRTSKYGNHSFNQASQ